MTQRRKRRTPEEIAAERAAIAARRRRRAKRLEAAKAPGLALADAVLRKAAQRAEIAAAEDRRHAREAASMRTRKQRLAHGIAERERLGRDDATPERLLKAGDGHDLAEGVKIRRVADAPLDRLLRRGELAPDDEETNRKLFEAAETYRLDWYMAGLSGVGALDPSRPSGDGTGEPSWSMPCNETAAHHRWRFRKARDALDAFLRVAVDGIVLEERGLDDVGRAISGRADRKQAVAVALDRLREGLRKLAKHYGMKL